MLSISSNLFSSAVILRSSEASEEEDDAPAGDAIQGFDGGNEEGGGVTLRRLSTTAASFVHSTAEPTFSPALAISAMNLLSERSERSYKKLATSGWLGLGVKLTCHKRAELQKASYIGVVGVRHQTDMPLSSFSFSWSFFFMFVVEAAAIDLRSASMPVAKYEWTLCSNFFLISSFLSLAVVRKRRRFSSAALSMTGTFAGAAFARGVMGGAIDLVF